MDAPDKIVLKVIDEQTDRIIAAIGRTPGRYIARDYGLHEQTVNDLITKRRRPTIKTLRILGKLLETDD